MNWGGVFGLFPVVRPSFIYTILHLFPHYWHLELVVLVEKLSGTPLLAFYLVLTSPVDCAP